MTRFIDIKRMQQIVTHTGLETFLSQLVNYIEEDYRQWNIFQKTARIANHSAEGVIELMPTASDKLYGFKYVNGHPKNALNNKLTVMAFGALADVETGFPLLLSEMTISTALRTAATSVLAAKYLCPTPRHMAVIGNGAQSEFQCIAFHRLAGVNEISLYDIDPAASEKLLSNLRDWPELTVRVCGSVREAVKGADIITTITADKKNALILTNDMVESGVYINAVGGDCPGKTELHPDILYRANVVVEYEPQSRIEGEIQSVPDAFAVTELWQFITGNVDISHSDYSITVFDSVGFALEDYSTLRYLYDLTEALDQENNIELIPTPENPRDLYQFVRR